MSAPSTGRGPAVTCAPATGEARSGPPAAPETRPSRSVLLFESLETQPNRPVARLNDSGRVFTPLMLEMRSTPSRPVTSAFAAMTTFVSMLPPTLESSSPSA